MRICGRLLLLTIDNRVLLVRETDPSVPGVQWWALPGGGVEPGEDTRAAAVREVAEETGYRIAPEQVGVHLWDREARYRYLGRTHHARESVYLVRVGSSPIQLVPTMSAEERSTILGCRWWPLPELLTATDTFVPARLPTLVRSVVDNDIRVPLVLAEP